MVCPTFGCRCFRCPAVVGLVVGVPRWSLCRCEVVDDPSPTCRAHSDRSACLLGLWVLRACTLGSAVWPPIIRGCCSSVFFVLSTFVGGSPSLAGSSIVGALLVLGVPAKITNSPSTVSPSQSCAPLASARCRLRGSGGRSAGPSPAGSSEAVWYIIWVAVFAGGSSAR